MASRRNPNENNFEKCIHLLRRNTWLSKQLCNTDIKFVNCASLREAIMYKKNQDFSRFRFFMRR